MDGFWNLKKNFLFHLKAVFLGLMIGGFVRKQSEKQKKTKCEWKKKTFSSALQILEVTLDRQESAPLELPIQKKTLIQKTATKPFESAPYGSQQFSPLLVNFRNSFLCHSFGLDSNDSLRFFWTSSRMRVALTYLETLMNAQGNRVMAPKQSLGYT